MSKYKEYYYYDIKRWLMMKDELPDNRLQMAIFANALKESLEETGRLPNGDLRLKAIDKILFKKVSTYEGMALELNYSSKTIQNWVRSFVNLVGCKAGF